MPQIRFHESLSVAQRVLRQINKQGGVPKALRDRVEVIGYTNGREQGYGLRSSAGGKFFFIYFAQNRKSDEIVVYSGHENPFNDGLTDKMYEERTLFPRGEFAKAAKFIRKTLLAAVKQGVAEEKAKMVTKDEEWDGADAIPPEER